MPGWRWTLQRRWRLYDVPSFVKTALPAAATPKNIQAGFQSSCIQSWHFWGEGPCTLTSHWPSRHLELSRRLSILTWVLLPLMQLTWRLPPPSYLMTSGSPAIHDVTMSCADEPSTSGLSPGHAFSSFGYATISKSRAKENNWQDQEEAAAWNIHRYTSSSIDGRRTEKRRQQ